MSIKFGPALTIVLTLVGAATANGGDIDRFNLAAVDAQIVPGYQALAKTSATLDTAARKACDAAEPDTRSLKQPFADSFLAWQAVQQVRFGPILAFNRGFRYQLWPDKRGTVGKHLRQLLAKPDPSRIEAKTFAGGSVALQGFGALERLLFDTTDLRNTDEAVWRCAVIMAITTNLRAMSQEMLDEWQAGPDAHRALIATANRGNAYYQNAEEVSANLLNGLHTQLELMVTKKLDRPLGGKRAMPKRAEAWRSELSLAALKVNLEAAEKLYQTAFAPRITEPELTQAFAQAFADAHTTAASIEQPLAEAVSHPESRAQVENLRTRLAALQTLVGDRLTAALGLSLGFNSLDGD